MRECSFLDEQHEVLGGFQELDVGAVVTHPSSRYPATNDLHAQANRIDGIFNNDRHELHGRPFPASSTSSAKRSTYQCGCVSRGH
ncbi:hypothetical protein D3C80_2023430 [compost metagenome]